MNFFIVSLSHFLTLMILPFVAWKHSFSILMEALEPSYEEKMKKLDRMNEVWSHEIMFRESDEYYQYRVFTSQSIVIYE